MSDNTIENNVNNFIKKVNAGKKGQLDLSADEDLSIAIMNLISIEEHFFFTAEKTEKDGYFDLLRQAREMRKSLLKKMIKEYEGEVWCISKHLLAASMRLMEVGTKQLGQGNTKEAKELFDKSFELYSVFWGLIKGVVPADNIKMKGDDDADELKDKFEVTDEPVKLASSAESFNKKKLKVSRKNGKNSKKKKNKLQAESEPAGGVFGKLKDLVKKAVDCCIE